MRDKLVIANCSGFYGDRYAAAAEMVRGGPIDVLTGDYLAELTLAILHRVRLKKPALGYAASFLGQMEEILGECLDEDIKIVVNAGGLNPAGLAAELQRTAERLGLHPKIAYIDGDDVVDRISELQAAGEAFIHMERGIPLSRAPGKPVTANVYLGGWGIAAALGAGADVVIAPRVTDAALVVGPAAWKFGWRRDDYNALAGAVAAGHVIECGPQACGGNYAFFDEVPSFRNIGFPIAEVYADGSSVITKHPDTGGIVSVGTVTAQLLYEIRGARYHNPDVTARFDTARLEQEEPDRVRIFDVVGEPPPDMAKVAVNLQDGYRNAMTMYLAGLHIEDKAEILEEQVLERLGGPAAYGSLTTDIDRTEVGDPSSNEDAVARFTVTVTDADADKAGREFSSKIVELAVSTVPGFKLATPPGDAVPNMAFWPALLSNKHVHQRVHVGGKTLEIPAAAGVQVHEPVPEVPFAAFPKLKDTVRLPFGTLFGTRSGDKGGSANLGVWAKLPEEYAFLCTFLTVEKLHELLPDLHGCRTERHVFPLLLAVNFYIEGLLDDGAISSSRFDPQAKTLGEYLRAKSIDFPTVLVPAAKA
jgi:hypothetical protein